MDETGRSETGRSETGRSKAIAVGNRTAKKQKKPTIQIGYQAGKLIVTASTPQRKSGYKVWRCQCSCGGEILLDTRCLQRGTVKDCGCETAPNPGYRNLTGMRFGRLVCLEPTSQRDSSGGIVWRCLCDCGKECMAVSTRLTRGEKKSCGCMAYPPQQDLTGRVFGRLTVLGREEQKNGTSYWRCRCECGRETVVRYLYLLSGHTKSCGCLQKEKIVDNLRLVDGTSVTILETMKDRLLANNTSGYNGIYWNKRLRKWAAQITFKGKTYYLGSYGRIEEAVKARHSAEAMHDDFLESYYEKHQH